MAKAAAKELAAEEFAEGVGKTHAAALIRDIKAGWDPRMEAKIYVKSQWAKTKNQSAIIHPRRTAREAGKPFRAVDEFGMHCFVIHNPGAIADFFTLDKNDTLGAGGTAKVYRAKEIKTHVGRAVKAISKKSVEDPFLLHQEVEIMKGFDHPNIVKVYETFEDNKFVYLVLELCEGGDLLQRLMSQGTLSEHSAAVIVRVVFMCINYLNVNGFCHRDIKPENLSFKESRSEIVPAAIRLSDFGYAHELPEKDCLLYTKVGSPYYVAPEVLAGQGYNERCDLWSTGILCYLLLCGYPPFAGTTDAETLNKIVTGKYIFHKEYWGTISKPAKHLVWRLLDYEPEQRISTKSALDHDWVKSRGVVRVERVKEETVDRLISFNQYHRLRRAAMLAIVLQLDAMETRENLELFQAMDLNGDGILTRNEFMRAIQACGVDDSFIGDMMNSVDADGSGVIDYSEFLAATLAKDKYVNNHPVLMRAFRSFDQDDSGSLTKEELFETLCMKDTDQEELDEFFVTVDLNGDGEMDYGEFYASLQREIEPGRNKAGRAEEEEEDQDDDMMMVMKSPEAAGGKESPKEKDQKGEKTGPGVEGKGEGDGDQEESEESGEFEQDDSEAEGGLGDPSKDAFEEDSDDEGEEEEDDDEEEGDKEK